MVASGSRTMIAGSSSSCTAVFRRSCRSSPSSGPRRSCVGTEPAFLATGVGSRADREGDRRSGAARIDPADERRKSALGRAAHPRRTAQARVWFEVAQSSVAKYMVKRRKPPSRGWRTFLLSCAEHCSYGLIRCPDAWLQTAVCPRRRSARPQRSCTSVGPCVWRFFRPK